MSEFVLRFDEVKAAHCDQAGGKGYTLARLCQAGFPVPPGFIIATNAYRAFVAANNLDERITETLQDSGPIAASACSIEAAFEEAEMPCAVAAAIRDAYLALGQGQVAIRSSAIAEDGQAASFAGQHETRVGVAGYDAVLAAVRHCWASLWSERALAYRRHLSHAPSLSHSRAIHAGMAVVMQEMVPVAQAGIAFTLDPVSGRRDVIVVEAVAGTGDALGDGWAMPRRYIVRRGNPYPDSRDGVLDATRLAAVVRLARQVELWAGQPQDVEWALDDAGYVYLLQARPITVAGSAPSENVIRWTRDNVGEVIPDPVTPLSWSVLDPLGNRAFARVRHRLGVGSCSVAGLFGRFYGRVYFNHTLYQATMSRFYFSRTNWHTIPRLALTALRAWCLLHCLPGESERVISTILRRRRSERGLDLASLAPRVMLARLDDWRRLGAAAMEVHLAVTVIADLLYQALDKLLARWSDGTTTAAALTTGLTGIRSAEAGRDLAALARRTYQDGKLRALVLTTPSRALSARLAETGIGQTLWPQIEAFLAQHGHGAFQEFELSAPRWRDDPALILSALRAQVHAAAGKPAADPTAAREAAVARIESRLGPLKRWLFRGLLCRTQAFTVARENLKYHLVIAHSRLRDLYLALAAWLADAGWLASAEDVFFLVTEEVTALAGGELTSAETQGRVAERRQAWKADRRAAPPSAFDQLADGRLRPVTPPVAPGSDAGRVLHGLAASPGSHIGRARVLCTPADDAEIEPGEVLIAPATSPGWAPLFLAAGALVTEIGGALSHGAIIAREYGLPAVLNVAEATRCIRTGQLVHVDGSQGIVQLLGEAS